MEKYPKRQKVKRYRRSFYSRAGLGNAYLVHRGAQPGSFRLLPRQRERIVRGGEPGVLCGQ